MGSGALFTTRTELRNKVAQVALVGELDVSSVPTLAEGLAPYLSDGVAGIVIDLRELTFLDSSGLHMLLDAKRRTAESGQRLVLVGATESSRRLFELTKTLFLLDEQEAVVLLDQFTGGRARRTARMPIMSKESKESHV
jgi:anti-sigma B factor antagonist